MGLLYNLSNKEEVKTDNDESTIANAATHGGMTTFIKG